MKKIFIIMIFQIFSISMLLSAAEQVYIADSYKSSLNTWINNEISSIQMFNVISDLDKDMEKQPLDRETYYWKSRLALLRGRIYYEQKEKKLSIRELENCLEFAEMSNKRGETSETFSTMAVANSLLMVQKGFLFTIANFSVSQDQADRALELDPENPHALLVRAQFLCNAPPIAGGNFDEGISMLSELSNRTDLSSADRFFILQSLAEIYSENKRKNEAAATCRLALSIFPGNTSCREFLSELEG